MTEVEDPLGGITKSVYDGDGRRIALIDPANGRTTMVYDARSSMTAIANPRDFRTTYTFNGRGETVSRRSANNVVTTYTFDEVGNNTNVAYPTENYERFYDENNNLVQWTDEVALPSNEAIYDLRNAMIEQIPSLGDSQTWTYDPAGQRTVASVPGDKKLAYTFDANGRTTTITDRSNFTVTMAYDVRGYRTTVTHASGRVEAYTFDADGRNTKIRTTSGSTVVFEETYTFDANGNRKTIVDNLGVMTTYTYDEKDRLTQDASTGPDAHTYNYTFDSRDNLLTTNESGTLTTMVYDSASRLVTSTAGAVVTTMTYDPNGNVTQVNAGGTITTMTYNPENQMRTHVVGGVTKAARYDINGYKRAELDGSTYVRYFYMDGPSIIAESNDAGTSFAKVTTFNIVDGLMLYGQFNDPMTALGDLVEFIPDYLGSVRGFTAGDKPELRQQPTRYRPFGSLLSGTQTLNYGWTGNTGSRRTGLTYAEQYNRARHYSTVLRQWTTVDPLWPTESAYGYVRGRPTVLIDVSGATPSFFPPPLVGPPVPPRVGPPDPWWLPRPLCPAGPKPGLFVQPTPQWNDWIFRFCNCNRGNPQAMIECDKYAREYHNASGKPKPKPGMFGPPIGPTPGIIAPRPKPCRQPEHTMTEGGLGVMAYEQTDIEPTCGSDCPTIYKNATDCSNCCCIHCNNNIDEGKCSAKCSPRRGQTFDDPGAYNELLLQRCLAASERRWQQQQRYGRLR